MGGGGGTHSEEKQQETCSSFLYLLPSPPSLLQPLPSAFVEPGVTGFFCNYTENRVFLNQDSFGLEIDTYIPFSASRETEAHRRTYPV